VVYYFFKFLHTFVDQLLSNPIISNKLSELKVIDPIKFYERQLLETIRIPRKLNCLADQLPSSNYNKSLENNNSNVKNPIIFNLKNDNEKNIKGKEFKSKNYIFPIKKINSDKGTKIIENFPIKEENFLDEDLKEIKELRDYLVLHTEKNGFP